MAHLVRLCQGRDLRTFADHSRIGPTHGHSVQIGRVQQRPELLQRGNFVHLTETGFPVSVLVRRSIKSALRSIRRGLANTTQKRAITLEFVPIRNAWQCSSDIPALPHTWTFCEDHSTLDPFPLCIAGSWFLCREIEIAAAKVQDVRFNLNLKTVSRNLPASKTDTAATGVFRTHGCSCSTDKATCDHQCLFHCLLQHLSNLRTFSRTWTIRFSSLYHCSQTETGPSWTRLPQSGHPLLRSSDGHGDDIH